MIHLLASFCVLVSLWYIQVKNAPSPVHFRWLELAVHMRSFNCAQVSFIFQGFLFLACFVCLVGIAFKALIFTLNVAETMRHSVS